MQGELQGLEDRSEKGNQSLMTKQCLWIAVSFTALVSYPAAAQTITGSARAVDGDSPFCFWDFDPFVWH